MAKDNNQTEAVPIEEFMEKLAKLGLKEEARVALDIHNVFTAAVETRLLRGLYNQLKGPDNRGNEQLSRDFQQELLKMSIKLVEIARTGSKTGSRRK